jgi:hypothetical protein
MVDRLVGECLQTGYVKSRPALVPVHATKARVGVEI